MNITKYSHACFVVEKAGSSLVVDPGGWTDDFVIPDTVIGIVVTHSHPDHCDKSLLQSIIDVNPQAVIYAHAEVIAQLDSLPTHSVSAGKTIHVGNFALTFVGGAHAVIDESMAGLANLGILIDNDLYYPGDSFALPGQPVEALAVPAAAPWMKFSEAAAFIRAVKPQQVFPTHDAILSETGKQLADRMLGAVCQEVGATYTRL